MEVQYVSSSCVGASDSPDVYSNAGSVRFWPHAVETAVYLINRSPTTTLKDRVAFPRFCLVLLLAAMVAGATAVAAHSPPSSATSAARIFPRKSPLVTAE